MVPRKHSPIVAMVCLMLSLLLATWANADTEILLGIKDQHINADDVCRAHLQAAAITASQFWDTTRPDSDIIEGFLPAVNTPCACGPLHRRHGPLPGSGRKSAAGCYRDAARTERGNRRIRDARGADMDSARCGRAR